MAARRPPPTPTLMVPSDPAPAGLAPPSGAAVAADVPPARLGRYVVRGELGRGGMGVVYRAEDPEIRRKVAVKVASGAAVLDEARINGQLEHPNIVPVYDLGQAGESVWFAMREVHGRTLHQVLVGARNGETGWTRHRLLTALVQVAQAVAYAHGRGVLHRDIKPSNILLGEYGEVFLVDWGIAGLVDGGAVEGVSKGSDAPGTLVGTPGFMSPEQANGIDALDARSDVWSLGVVLFEVLTLRSPFPGRTARERLQRMLSGPPPDPREVAPDREIPDELAEICLRALRHARDERTPSASAFAGEIEAFLEGSRRRAEAARLLGEARAQWSALADGDAERTRLELQERALEAQIPAWAPLSDKGELLTLRRRLAELGQERIDGLERVLGTCERALSQDPSNAEVRRFLADVNWARFVEAEAAGDRAGSARFRSRVEAHDDGRYRARLRGTGAVSLRSDVPAEVVARRFDPRDLVWTLGPATHLGRTPLDEVPLEMGSWLLELRAGGRDPVRYPVHVTRSRHWDAGLVGIPAPGEIAAGFAYVPAGPFVRGGDPEPQASRPREEVWLPAFAMAVFPVTMGEWLAFLNALHAVDPDLAWERCPRLDAGLDRSGDRLLARPTRGERYGLPERDDFGEWRSDLPVHSVSWEDAVAYAAWRSTLGDGAFALPTEDQFEKAARGVDARTYPWGDGFDASLCKMNASRPGLPTIEPVGAFPTDVSVYGVRDLAGSMRAWCADPTFDGDPLRRPVRGGSYATNARVSRAAVRYGSPFRHTIPYQGVRLVQRLWSSD